MVFFYNIGIKAYYIIILLASLFYSKAGLWIRGRRGLLKAIKQTIKTDEKKIWVHCSSLGEFEQARPLIDRLKEQYPATPIVVTFFSPSGYKIRKNYEKVDYVFYLPLDTKRNASLFIKTINPAMVFFIKYEYWYHYLHILKMQKIPVFIVSAIYRKRHIFFRWYGFWFKKILNCFTYFYVQDKYSANLLSSIGITQVDVTGDTRFDRVYSIAQQSPSLPLIQLFKQDKLLLIAGSTWGKDDQLLVKYINQYADNSLKFILVPHEINPEKIHRLCITIKKMVIKYSEANDKNIDMAEVLLIDNVGMLSAIYKYGDIAYIGGGFGKGIHNILEPATFGMPILFGPRYQKFQEAISLISQGVAFTVSEYEELKTTLNNLLTDKAFLYKTKSVTAEFIRSNLGATDHIIAKSAEFFRINESE